MNPALSTDDPDRPRFLVRDTAGINRLIVHLFTRWTLPLIVIHIDSLPAVVAQLTQDRIVRISNASKSGPGVVLASTAVVIGIVLGWTDIHSMIWTSRQFWQFIGLVALGALYAGLFGWGVGAAWSRLRLMLVLQRLRRRIMAGVAVDEPARYTGRVEPASAVNVHAAIEDEDVAHEARKRRTGISRPRRPTVHVHNNADLKRLAMHLFTHWKLPGIRISVAGVATLDVQRAQHRIARLSESCHCVLGASLAGATLLGGTFAVEWISSHTWDWWVPEAWGPLGLIPVAALGAALIGVAIELAWTRVKLMLVLHGVRHELGA